MEVTAVSVYRKTIICYEFSDNVKNSSNDHKCNGYESAHRLKNKSRKSISGYEPYAEPHSCNGHCQTPQGHGKEGKSGHIFGGSAKNFLIFITGLKDLIRLSFFRESLPGLAALDHIDPVDQRLSEGYGDIGPENHGDICLSRCSHAACIKFYAVSPRHPLEQIPFHVHGGYIFYCYGVLAPL